MLWAASTLCFFGFMRAGELTVPSDKSFDDSSHLTCKDVSVDSIETPKVLEVQLILRYSNPHTGHTLPPPHHPCPETSRNPQTMQTANPPPPPPPPAPSPLTMKQMGHKTPKQIQPMIVHSQKTWLPSWGR